MDFKEIIRKRHSIRDYTERVVEASVIQRVIDAAIQAPSARNLQPWEFWVVLGQDRVDNFSDRAKKWLLEQLSCDPAQQEVYQQISSPAFSMLYHAPAIVLVVATGQEEQADEDCCLAANLLMLAARDVEFGTCWIGLSRAWFNLQETKKELGIPDTYRVVAPIVMGHPKEWTESHGRSPAKVHWLS